jgi:hypothetical protein
VENNFYSFLNSGKPFLCAEKYVTGVLECKAFQSKQSYLSNSSNMPIPEKVVVTVGVS